MSEGKPRARAAAPWDVAASICRGTNRDGPGLGGQRRPAGPRARKAKGGHVERDGPKWVCQRLAVEREAYHLLQPPPPSHRRSLASAGTGGSAIVVSRWDARDAERVAGAQHCHGCFWPLGCTWLLRAVAGTAWGVLALTLQLLGGLGKGEKRVEASSRRVSRPAVTAASSPLCGGGEGCAEAAGRLGM